ncbi:MAG TPA: hypothetical protein VHB79_05010 [Polyangiaceae bacterium]|nr:hypothetical protein [Polyangiaceae bacterium]
MKGSRLMVGVLLLGNGCAHLHQLQIADIDSTGGTLEPFEVQVNATGLSVHDSAEVAKLFATSEHSKKNLDNAEQIIAMTQMGPKTGDPTFSDDWADGAAAQVLERCPTGHVTGLSARRETMDYPVISGEIVTIKGYCIQ